MITMSQGGAKINAVVWRSAGSAVPADLIAALSRQGIAWEDAIGRFDALSRVLARRADGPGGRVLLLVEPRDLGHADEVLTALERFDPATKCWAFRVGKSPQLSPYAPPARPAEPQVVVRPGPTPRAGHQLKLAGEGAATGPGPAEPDSPGAQEPEGRREPDSPRSLLTPEELEMLLADSRE